MFCNLHRAATLAWASVLFFLWPSQRAQCTGGNSLLGTSRDVKKCNKAFFRKGVAIDCSGPLTSAVHSVLRTQEMKKTYTLHCLNGRMKDGWPKWRIPEEMKDVTYHCYCFPLRYQVIIFAPPDKYFWAGTVLMNAPRKNAERVR